MSLINLASFGRTALNGAIHLLYPNVCWTCGNGMTPEQGPVCAACLPRLTIDPYPTCPRCSSTVGPHLNLDAGCPECCGTSFAFDGAIRMAPYDGLLREVILKTKQWTGEDLTEVMARLWAQTMAPRLARINPDIVIPVPLHWRRHWWRGFNASNLLARQLANNLKAPVRFDVLRRIRGTAQQTRQTSTAARRDNVHRAFAARPAPSLAGRTIVLVDDVLTTGATASEAARALRACKPAAIFVAVLAHGR